MPLSADLLSIDVQKKLLESTVLSPLCKRYPPALSYQRAFVKKFLQKVSITGEIMGIHKMIIAVEPINVCVTRNVRVTYKAKISMNITPVKR